MIITNHYNQYGYLERVTGNGETYWQGIKINADGNFIVEKTGPITQKHQYNNKTGRLETIKSTNAMGDTLQDNSYRFSARGNLITRTSGVYIDKKYQYEQGNRRVENFCYDHLDRLIGEKNNNGNCGDQRHHQMSYDPLGNITSKYQNDQNTADYLYGLRGTAGPHAVTKVGTTVYDYDRNGNNTESNNIETNGRKTERTLTWS